MAGRRSWYRLATSAITSLLRSPTPAADRCSLTRRSTLRRPVPGAERFAASDRQRHDDYCRCRDRINRQIGDAFADGDVKTTYSDLKPQPNGALLATSDPIHVTALHMTSSNSPAWRITPGMSVYGKRTNVVRAPKIDFDSRTARWLLMATPRIGVEPCLCSKPQDGKLTPVDVTADKLTYTDAERRPAIPEMCWPRATEPLPRSRSMSISKPATRRSNRPRRQSSQPAMPGYRRPQQDRSHGRYRNGGRHGTKPARSGRPACLHGR